MNFTTLLCHGGPSSLSAVRTINIRKFTSPVCISTLVLLLAIGAGCSSDPAALGPDDTANEADSDTGDDRDGDETDALDAGEEPESLLEIDEDIESHVRAAAVPERGSLTLAIVDYHSGDPIEDAQLSTESASIEERNGHVLELNADTGRLILRVEVEGYTPWMGAVPVTGSPSHVQLRLLPRTVNEQMTSMGGSVTVGEAELDFPQGAVSNTTSLDATWIGTDDLEAASGARQWVDVNEGGLRSLRNLGVLDVDIETQPQEDIRVEVPVPQGTQADELLLFHLDDEAHWVEPRSPLEVSQGHAVFSVEHFSSLGVFQNAGAPEEQEYLVSASSMDPYPAGSTIAAGTTVETWLGAGLTVIDGLGNQIVIGPKSRVVFENPVGSVAGPAAGDDWLEGAGSVLIEKGDARLITNGEYEDQIDEMRDELREKIERNRAKGGIMRSRFQHRSSAMGVRGSTVSLKVVECADRNLVAAQVAAGRARLMTSSGAEELSAGAGVELCEGCEDEEFMGCCGWNNYVSVGMDAEDNRYCDILEVDFGCLDTDWSFCCDTDGSYCSGSGGCRCETGGESPEARSWDPYADIEICSGAETGVQTALDVCRE